MTVEPGDRTRNAAEDDPVRDELIRLVDVEAVVGRLVQAAEGRGEPVGDGLFGPQVHPGRTADGET